MTVNAGPDVLGVALSEYHARPSEDLVTTLEFDTGETWEQPVSAYFAGREQWGELEAWLFGEIRGRLLDVGCGAGRLSAEATAVQGAASMLGIDTSPGAVRIATERGLDALVATFPEGLVEPSVSAAPWDCVALFGNNLGLLQQCRSASIGIDALARVLAPHGRLLITAGKPGELPPAVLAAGAARSTPGAFRARLRHRELVGDWFDYAFFEPGPALTMLSARGWSIDMVRETGSQWAAVAHRST